MKKFTLLLATLAISLVTFAQGKITYELNGGVTNDYGWKNKGEMFDAFMKDNGSTAHETLDYYKQQADPLGAPNICTHLTTCISMLNDSAKWNWLKVYMQTVTDAQIAGGIAATALDNSCAGSAWRYATGAFFVDIKWDKYPKSADYSVAGQLEAFQPTWKHGFCGPDSIFAGDTIVLPTPYKEGESFVGWYRTPDFSDERVSVLTYNKEKEITLYAKFGEYIPCIKEVIDMENDSVTKVQGTVTYVGGSNFWIQDATAGILCYGENHGLVEGDLVVLSGKKTIYKSSPELDGATLVEKVATGKEVGAQTLLLSAVVADATNDYLNELVLLQGVTFSKYEDNGNYKTPYVTDGINEIALFNWKDVTEDKYPVGTKVSVKAVLSIYNTKLQLRGKEEWIAVAAAAGKDNYEYPEVNVDGFKFNLANNWMYSVTLENWVENRPNPLGEGSRSVIEKDGILYFPYRDNNTPNERPKLVRVDAKTGKMLTPVLFAENMFKDADGNWYYSPFNDLKLDNAGNAITSNISQQFQVWTVDLETGAGELLIDCATDKLKWMSAQFPDIKIAWNFDRIGVYGDVKGDAIIMTALRESTYVLYWTINNGEWNGRTRILPLGGFAEGTNFGTATVPCPIEGDLFYIDGFNTYPMLFNLDGDLVDSFDEETDSILFIGSQGHARAKGHNGVTEFEVNGEYYLIIAGDNTVGNGTAPSTFVLYKFADEYREFKDMTPLYEFPMKGMGAASNPQRIATSFARPNEDGTAVEIYAFTAENGYGAYTLSIAEDKGDPVLVDNLAIDSNVWVENNTIVANAQIEGIFTVAGQNVTALNGNLTAGAYIVRTAEGIAKVMVK